MLMGCSATLVGRLDGGPTNRKDELARSRGSIRQSILWSLSSGESCEPRQCVGLIPTLGDVAAAAPRKMPVPGPMMPGRMPIADDAHFSVLCGGRAENGCGGNHA
jgi:hypothetical protein